jgi:hypothetical protein
MELKLHNRSALDGLRFYVFNARDVEEVILVAVGEVALHLGGVHAAERLGDVNRRNAERRKNIARHALDAEHGGECDCEDENDHRKRTTQGELQEIHAG